MKIDKPFKTQYDARDRIQSHPGNPIKQLYVGSYNERGQVELKEDGTEQVCNRTGSRCISIGFRARTNNT